MNIGVVIVTYNRLNDLKKAIKCYEDQTHKPKYIIVVNNNSTDGTYNHLEEWKNKKNDIEKYVVNLEKNIGGSGGFYEGLKMALNLNCQWIWVADDDAFARVDALKNASKFIEENVDNTKNISAICGEVINNGITDISHRRRIVKSLNTIKQDAVPKEEYEKKYFEIDLFSYVGSIINKDFLNKVGLTEKDYFIYYDDTEHSLRLAKVGRILCVPSVKIDHNLNVGIENELNWKSYYSIRNKLRFYKKHFNKRYYIFEKYKILAKANIKKVLGKDLIRVELTKQAILDEKNNAFGLNKIYKPGWKPD